MPGGGPLLMIWETVKGLEEENARLRDSVIAYRQELAQLRDTNNSLKREFVEYCRSQGADERIYER